MNEVFGTAGEVQTKACETGECHDKIFAAEVEKLDEVMDFIDDNLTSAGCSSAVIQKINLVVEEVFVNIASYAYDHTEGKAEISVSMEDSVVSIIFRDNGQPFDPLKKEEPDVTLPASKREIGGLGIFLVKKIMDEVLYEYSDGQNVLTVKKRIV